jgi:hypothetical protein
MAASACETSHLLVRVARQPKNGPQPAVEIVSSRFCAIANRKAKKGEIARKTAETGDLWKKSAGC